MRNTLKRIREVKGYTLREMGELIGFNYSYYSRVEKGERDGSYIFWEKIRSFYGIEKSSVWRLMIEES